jgi:RHS repeat-associated protein
VEYVHGHRIDQPLRFYREEYSDSIPGASFIPQANWRGVYDRGVRDGRCYERTWTTQLTTPPDERQIGGVDTTSTRSSGTETLCADVAWPAQYTWAYHQYRRGYHGPYNWMGALGSLAFGMRDASGLHYRRNRFYDAEQGRFTQEDPIGLAGGINLYGYANGGLHSKMQRCTPTLVRGAAAIGLLTPLRTG